MLLFPLFFHILLLFQVKILNSLTNTKVHLIQRFYWFKVMIFGIVTRPKPIPQYAPPPLWEGPAGSDPEAPCQSERLVQSTTAWWRCVGPHLAVDSVFEFRVTDL